MSIMEMAIICDILYMICDAYLLYIYIDELIMSQGYVNK